MILGDLLTADSVALDVAATSREAALEAVIAVLGVTERQRATLLRLLERRELLGSTAVGRGIAIPHCRTLVVTRLRLAYIRLATPLAWQAPDHEPVRHVFLIVAPPIEVSNQYLPTLGRLAQFARHPGTLESLGRARDVAEALTTFNRALER
jgi:mannitol/fructose-specific phosphotransferase system IIA component (Ntr-type)